jgi:predicted ester cyclase
MACHPVVDGELKVYGWPPCRGRFHFASCNDRQHDGAVCRDRGTSGSHFEAVNRRDIQTVLANMQPGLYDHELEGDHRNDLREGAQRLQVLMKQVPDLKVDVRDVIADGDKVVVRAVWRGTDAVSQLKVEFHGFVQWRIAVRKIC